MQYLAGARLIEQRPRNLRVRLQILPERLKIAAIVYPFLKPAYLSLGIETLFGGRSFNPGMRGVIVWQHHTFGASQKPEVIDIIAWRSRHRMIAIWHQREIIVAHSHRLLQLAA